VSEFVNYNKRGITLPAGCKDLAEVLRRKALRKTHWVVPAGKLIAQVTTKSEKNFSGTLGAIRLHVAKVYLSRAQLVGLSISPPDDSYSVEVFRMDGQELAACMTFGNDRERERTVRAFCAAHSLHVPRETSLPDTSSPDPPFEFSYLISPMPSEHQMLSKIATDFFLEICQVNEKSLLKFCYFEITIAA
jgi:hypothetical protein